MVWIIAVIIGAATYLSWFVSITVDKAINGLKDALREEFDKKYLGSQIAGEVIKTITSDVRDLHERINTVEKYAHDGHHDVQNKLQSHELRLARLES